LTDEVKANMLKATEDRGRKEKKENKKEKKTMTVEE
jgi:hypothetical protein